MGIYLFLLPPLLSLLIILFQFIISKYGFYFFSKNMGKDFNDFHTAFIVLVDCYFQKKLAKLWSEFMEDDLPYFKFILKTHCLHPISFVFFLYHINVTDKNFDPATNETLERFTPLKNNTACIFA